VATPVGGTAEVVKDGATGLLVTPGQSEQLAGAICRLLDAPQLAATMGQHGRALVEQEYSWDRAAEQTLSVYQEVTRP
jgi:glycosyltransferase involved in cell wall biosynthesis